MSVEDKGIKLKSRKQIFKEQEEKEFEVAKLSGELEEKKNFEHIEKVITRQDFKQLQKRFIIPDEEGFGKFYIGTGKHVEGQITYLENEQKQKIILGKICKSNDMPYIIYLDKKMSRVNETEIWDVIEAEFYLYKFMTKEKEYQIFSTEKLEIGDYNIWGTELEILDHLDLGNAVKMNKKLPIIFVHSAFSK